MTHNRHIPKRLYATTALVSVVSALMPQASYAAPTGGQVNAGQASITSGANKTTIDQTSQRAVIDWSSFNVGSGEAVQFIQPSASSIALNRIHDANPSSIDGSLTANGQVWLVNPNGVMFGNHAQVNVGGLLATTSDIDNGSFMSGDYSFSHPGNPNATIGNYGHIVIENAGLAALVGPNVTNDGLIEARLGKVQLGSGDTFTLDLYGDGLINLQASKAITSQLVSNSGTIKADGGSVLMTAAAAQSTVNSLINMTGVIQADTVGDQEGHIVLYAQGSNAVVDNAPADKGQEDGNSAVIVSGRLRASGRVRGGRGGSIEVLGDDVDILTGSVIDASGDAGGGSIKIGGDFHGAGDTPTALNTVIQTGTTIDASAITTGDGGSVAVWSDGSTDFAGAILAHGGAQSGNGGYVETSGHELQATGTVNASATNGNAGTWLLDPNNILIDQASCTGTSCSSANTIGASLSGGTNVTVTTSDGSITLDNSTIITDSGSTNVTLTFNAGTDILMNASSAITASGTGKLGVTFNADTAAGGGVIVIHGGSSITTNGGSVALGGGGGAITAGSGFAVGDATDAHGVDLSNALINASSGDVIINGKGIAGGSTDYGIELQQASNITTSGNITLTGQGGGSAAGTNNYGVYLTGASTLVDETGAGNLSITGTGGSTTGTGDTGIQMDTNTVVETTSTGNIYMAGIGGGTGAGGATGFAMQAAVKSTVAGGGSITLIGYGGDVGGNQNSSSDRGVFLNSAGGVSSVDGAIVIDGNTGIVSQAVTNTSGNSSVYGVQFGGGGNVTSTGNATITITGIGGGATTNTGLSSGVYFQNGTTQITSKNSDIVINGTGGSGTNAANAGIYIGGATSGAGGNVIYTTGSGNITLTGVAGNGSSVGIYSTPQSGTTSIGGASDTGSITFNTNTLTYASTTIQTSGAVIFAPTSTGTTVGVAGGAGVLQITTGAGSVLNSISSASEIDIGLATDTTLLTAGAEAWGANVKLISGSGGISVTGAQTMSAHNLTLQTDGDVALSGNLTGTGNLVIKPTTGTTTMDIGGTSNTLDLSTTDMGYIISGWASETFGASGNAGAVKIDANTFNDNTNIYGGAITTGGNIVMVKNLTIGSSADITTSNTISKTSGSTATLTLQAAGNITLGANDGISGATGFALNVLMDSDYANGAGGGYIYLNSGANITTFGGNITMGGNEANPASIVAGTGYAVGSSSNNSQYGIYVGNTLDAGGGNIIMNGEGGSYASGGDDGIYVHGSTVQTSGTGWISLTGEAGTSTSGTNYGIFLDKNATASAITGNGTGAISLTGFGGSGGTQYGLGTDANADTIGASSGYSGNITLQADSVSFGTGTVIKTSGTMLIEPYATTTAVSSGGASTSSTSLSLTDTYLGYISGESSLTIGNANDTGTLTLNAHSGWSAPTAFLTKSTGNIVISGDQTSTSTLAFTGPTALSGNLTDTGTTFNSAVTLGASSTISDGSGTLAFGGAVNGGFNLTAAAGTMSFGGAWGGSTPLSAVSLTSTNALSLPSISAASIFVQTTGATSDLTLTGQLVASGAGTPVTLVAARNFTNSDVADGANAIDLTGGGGPRWLIYSTTPTANTLNGLTEAFHRFTCAYGGSCPTLGSGNGLLYTLSPTITVTADNISGTYGSIGAFTASYSGFVGTDNAGSVLTGTPSLTTNATTSTSGNYNYSATPWTITAAAGTLANAMGYQLAYATGTLTIAKKDITASLNGSTEEKTYDGTTTASLGSDYTLTGLVGIDHVSLSATGAYDTKDAGSGKTVSYTSLGLGNTDAADYNLTTASLSDAHGLIDQATLTVTAKNVSGTYGSVSLDDVGGFTSSGLVSGDAIDSVTLTTNATLSSSGNYNYHSSAWTIAPSAATGVAFNAANYSITYNNASTGLTIAKKDITASLNGSTEEKTYDGTTTASLGSDYTLTGLVGIDHVSLSATGAYDTKDAGSGKTVSYTSLGLGNTDAADYNLTTASLSDAHGLIDQATLTVTAKNVSGTYGSVSLDDVGGFTSSGLVSGDAIDSVTLTTNATLSSSGNYNYHSSAWTISASAATGAAFNAANYSITYNNASTGLTIAKKDITASLNGSTEEKTYDGTTTASLGSDYTLTGLVGIDHVSLSATGAYDTKDAGSGKTVSYTSLGLGNTDAADYNLTTASLSDAHGLIDQATLTVTAKNVSGTYGSVSLDDVGGFTSSGLVSGDAIDSVTLATNATLSSSGNYNYHSSAWTISASNATGAAFNAANYSITYNNASTGLTIAKKDITASLNGSTEEKTYDGTTTASLGSDYTLTGLVGIDHVSLSATGAYDTKDAGSGKTVSYTSLGLGNTDAADYNLTTASLSDAHGLIDQATLTVTAKNVSGTYGSVSLDDVGGFTSSGLVSGDAIDSVTLTTNATLSSSGNYNYHSSAWTIAPSAATGVAFNAANYSITYNNASTGLTIAKKDITASLNGSTEEKTYDGTTTASLGSDYTLTGLVGIDHVSLSATGAYDTKDAGSGKTVSYTSLGLGNTDAADYNLTTASLSDAHGLIDQATLTVTAKNVSGTYGSVSLDDVGGFTSSGLVSGDAIDSVTLTTNATLSSSGNYNYHSSAWTISASAATGAAFNAANYSITYNNASTGLTIAKKDITASLNGSTEEKTYDGTTTASLGSDYTLTGLVGIDHVSLSATGAYDTKDAGSGKTVSYTSLGLGNTDAADYNLTTASLSDAHGLIDQATLTVTADDNAKAYGGTDPAFTYAYSGLVTGDSSSVFSGHLTRDAGENVGDYTINQGTLSAGGNYNISYTPGTFTISTATLLAVLADDQTKVYGAALPTLTFQASGFVNGDTALTVLTGALATNATQSSSVGTYSITKGTLAVNSNYVLSFTGGTLTVTAAPLTITAKNISGTYGSVGLNGTTGFTSSGLVNGDTVNSVTLTTNATTSTSGNYNYNATPWTITPSTALGTGLSNYNVTYATGTLTIAKKDITASLNGSTEEKTYDGTTTASLGSDYTLTGLVGIDHVSLSATGAYDTKDAGSGKTVSYTSLGLGNTDAADYNLTTASLSDAHGLIDQATLTVTAVSGQHKTAGQSDPALSYNYSGFLGGDTGSLFTGLLSRSAGENAGNYAISLGTLFAGGNYGINFSSAFFTINAAAVAPAPVVAQPAPVLQQVTGLVNPDVAVGENTNAPLVIFLESVKDMSPSAGIPETDQAAHHPYRPDLLPVGCETSSYKDLHASCGSFY